MVPPVHLLMPAVPILSAVLSVMLAVSIVVAILPLIPAVFVRVTAVLMVSTVIAGPILTVAHVSARRVAISGAGVSKLQSVSRQTPSSISVGDRTRDNPGDRPGNNRRGSNRRRSVRVRRQRAPAAHSHSRDPQREQLCIRRLKRKLAR
jgi:hypothetical protein